MGLDFLGGALSGGVMAGVGAGAGKLRQNRVENGVGTILRKFGSDEQIDALIREGKEISGEAQKLAEELQEKREKGRKVTDMEIGRLFSAVDAAPVNAVAAETGEGIVLPTEAPRAAEGQETASQSASGETFGQTVLPDAAEMARQRKAAHGETELERTAAQYGVKEETLARVQRISRILGREAVFFNEAADERGGIRNGMIGKDGVIRINAQSENPVAQIISHELTHSIEQSGRYAQFSKLVLDRVARSADLEQLRRNKRDLYARHGVELSDNSEIDRELVAEYVEKNLLTDEQSIRELVQTNRTLGQRIAAWIDSILAKLGRADAQERRFLSEAKRLYAGALRETGDNTSSASLREAPSPQGEGTRGAEEGKRKPTDYETLRQQLADGIESGQLTEQEYDKAMTALDEAESQESGEQFSISETRNMPWKKQVEGYFAQDGTIRSSDSLYIGVSSPNIRRVSSSPLYIPTSVVKKAIRIPHGSRSAHALTKADIMGLQEGIKNAPAVIVNPARNALIYVTDRTDADGRIIIAAFDLDNDLYGEIAHRATSIHSRESIEGLLNNLGHDATVLIKDKKGLDRLLPGTGIQSSKLLANVEFAERVSQEGENVKPQNSITEERSFPSLIWSSSAKSGAQEEKTSFDDSINEQGTEVKTQNSISEGEAQHSNGYNNLLKFFQAATSRAGLEFYADMIDIMEEKGYLKDGEAEALREAYTKRWDEMWKDRQFSVSEDKGGTVAQLRRYLDGEIGREELPGYAGKRSTETARTTRRDGAQKIIDAARAQGVSVEQYLRENFERYEYDGRLNAEARRALQRERGSGFYLPTELEGRMLPGGEEYDEPQYSISERYAQDVQEWYDEGQPEGETFILGETGEVLQGLGAIESDIYMNGDKITEILEKHPEMTIETIKRIPEVLDDPVLVLKSRNVGRGTRANTRLTMFGSVKGADGRPVMCVLDLRPIEGGFLIADMQRVNSAYTKDVKPVDFVRNSPVLYADKKRSLPLLRDIGFKMPMSLLRNGSTGSISYSGDSVNIEGMPFSSVVAEGKTQNSISERYAQDVQEWYDAGQPEGETFILGETGEVLQGLGAIESDVYMNGDKITEILEKHPEMTVETIKRIPEVLDDPVLVLKSRNAGRGTAANTRLAIFGTVKAQNGAPALVILDLRPVENHLVVDDMQRVTSAYIKERPIRFIQKSEVLHADKRRTPSLLRTMGFQMPIELQRSGSMGSISYNRQNVNIEGVPFSSVVAEEKAQNSISELRETMPKKAQNYLERAERSLENRIATALDVPRAAKRETLRPIIREISDTFLQSGRISEEKLGELFDRAYDEGIVIDRAFYDQYKHIKDHLRTTPVTISEQDKFTDFESFRKSAFGRLNIVNEGGVPVDVAYDELTDMAPELFPDSIVGQGDELQQMLEVARSIEISKKNLGEYDGAEAETFRRWRREEFDKAVNDALSALRLVSRYTQERAQQDESVRVTTPEEAKEAWSKLKQARRTYERANARNLLTESDEMELGRLLRGEIAPGHLNQEKNNVKGILDVYEAKKEYDALCRLLKDYKSQIKARLRKEADGYLDTAIDWKDKKTGIQYMRETMERNIADIVPDKELAQRITDYLITPVHEAEARSAKWKTEFRDKVRALDLSRKVEKGNEVSEAYAVQLLGEATDNMEMIERSRGRLNVRDGKTYDEWKAEIADLKEKNPNLNWAKIDRAIESFRKIYDELFGQLNEVRVRNGYEPINYRHGYFPHFQQEGDNIIAQFGRAMGVQTEVTALPTTINGMTHNFRPGITWFGHAQERTGFQTAYDAVEGFDKYIEGAASVVHQTDNIQRLRAFAAQVRYNASDEGIRKQVDDVRADTRLTEEEKQLKIEKIYEEGKFTLSNFVAELDEYTNLLANKKSRLDRGIEKMMGRRVYTVMKNLESRVGANMIAGNLSSALTNFIPLAQANAQMGTGNLLKGMWQTLQAYKEDDGIVDMSTFLTNRRGSDPIVQSWAQKAGAALGTPMEFIDRFTADSIVRARYAENLRRGLSEESAMQEADSFAAHIMADRSKGSMPTLFESRNPFIKMFTQFQLEVNNQFSEVFKDLPRGYRDKGIAALAAVLLKYFFGAWLYNEVYEHFVGRRAALDPIGILNDTVGDLTGYELPNLLDLSGDILRGETPDIRTQKVGVGQAGTNLAENIGEELPFTALLALIDPDFEGGRIPVSAAIPDLKGLWSAATGDYSGRYKWRKIQTELNKLAYLLPPFGGNQAQKIWKGTKALFAGGSYSVSTKGEDILQYPIFEDSGWETAGTTLRMALFGKNSMPTAQDWVENGFDSLSAKQTLAYKDMTDAGVSDRDAYELVRVLGDAEKTDDASKAAVQRGILRDSGVSGDGKAIAYYSIVANDKERELMDRLDDVGMDAGRMLSTLMDVRDAAKQKDRLDAIAKARLSDREVKEFAGFVLGTDILTEAGNPTKYASLVQAIDKGLSGSDALRLMNEGVNLADYLDYVDSGMNTETARDLVMSLSALKPENGKKQVSDAQKWRAAIDAVSESEQMRALENVMDESQYAKLETAVDFGVEPETWVKLKEELPKYDADGNGHYTNAETQAAIDALGNGTLSSGIVLPGGSGYVTSAQKAVLWQLMTGSTSAKNNPYSTEVGQRVLEAKGQERNEGTVIGGIMLPTSTVE